jgi:hypothetical protein
MIDVAILAVFYVFEFCVRQLIQFQYNFPVLHHYHNSTATPLCLNPDPVIFTNPNFS